MRNSSRFCFEDFNATSAEVTSIESMLWPSIMTEAEFSRERRRYSQEGFADQCGVHRTFMGTVERGESNLSFSNIAKVADTLGVTLSVLFLSIEEKAGTMPESTSRAAPSFKPANKKAGAK